MAFASEFEYEGELEGRELLELEYANDLDYVKWVTVDTGPPAVSGVHGFGWQSDRPIPGEAPGGTCSKPTKTRLIRLCNR